jgi:hypothetical protein
MTHLKKTKFVDPICTVVTFSLFWALKTHFRIGRIGRHEDKKNPFSALVLEFFCQSKLNIQKIQ